jgi:hypothetical protein
MTASYHNDEISVLIPKIGIADWVVDSDINDLISYCPIHNMS